MLSGQPAIVVFQNAIHEDVLNSFRKLRRVLIRGMVNDGLGIEDGDIGEEACAQNAAIAQPLALCGQGSDLANRLLQRQHVFVANVVAEEARHRTAGPGMRVRLEQWTVER